MAVDAGRLVRAGDAGQIDDLLPVGELLRAIATADETEPEIMIALFWLMKRVKAWTALLGFEAVSAFW